MSELSVETLGDGESGSCYSEGFPTGVVKNWTEMIDDDALLQDQDYSSRIIVEIGEFEDNS